jgi:broad specificity phosphatase PhoE
MREEQDEASWPLTETGHMQAGKTGNWINRHLGSSYDGAYVSPFLRTRQTADDLGLPVEWKVDDRIREREWGDYAAPGAPVYDVDQYLVDLARCSNLDWKTPFPGAESVLDMVPRVANFLRDSWLANPTGRIVAVTHGGTIRAFQTVLEQLCVGPNCPDHRLSNCCVVMYHLEAIDIDRWSWTGQVRTAHPVLEGEPETAWEPVGSTPMPN